jgi:hypothetical protein
MGLLHSPLAPTDGLVLCLDSANRRSYPGSGNTWFDLSGNGNHAILNNGPAYNNSNGGSIVFDGFDDYGIVSCSQFQSGNNPFSVECWFRWSGNGTNVNNVIFGYGLDTTVNQCPVIGIASSKFQLQLGSNSGAVDSSTSIQINTWYHGVALYDKTTTKVYLNGRLENSTNYSSANIILSGSNGTNAGIGCLFSSYGNLVSSPQRYGTFNGNISTIKYYNRALTISEIRQSYNAVRRRYGL